jgi:hypothetical protein
MLGLSVATVKCTFILLIISFLVYTGANSGNKVLFAAKLGQKFFILCVAWTVLYEI